MTEAPVQTDVPVQTGTVLVLTPDEVALLRAALNFLRATLGRDEADQLAEVQTLLRRLDAA